jgi:hypothetical protein
MAAAQGDNRLNGFPAERRTKKTSQSVNAGMDEEKDETRRRGEDEETDGPFVLVGGRGAQVAMFLASWPGGSLNWRGARAPNFRMIDARTG